jgi:23S rRNA (uracil1939-C5)-methyltransferase
VQDVPYAEQLARKRVVVRGLLQRALGRSAPKVEPVIGADAPGGDGPWGFRHKAAFVFAPDPRSRRGLVMGHYEAGSQRVVSVNACPVHASRANRIAFAHRDRLARAGVSAAGRDLDGILRHLVIRTSRDEREAIAMLVVTRNDRSLRAPVKALLASDERPDGFYVSVHPRPGPYMVGEETIHLDGKTHVRETCGGASFLVSPTAFFQTNPSAAEVLVRLVVDAVGSASTSERAPVVDLYAGSGLFALPLAMAGHAVTAVEENRQAVRDGERNQRLNKVPPERVRWIAGRVEEWCRVRFRFPPRAGTGKVAGTETYPGKVRVSETYPGTAAVLDPPRQGCAPAVIDAVFRGLAPRRAVYVSCNPESLAAELPAIVDAGYAIARVQPVDMFPHTDHVETVVTLDRKAARRT